MGDSPFESWPELEIVRPLGAVYTRGQAQIGTVEVVAETSAESFWPYFPARFDIYN